jgi:hypothetical protein
MDIIFVAFAVVTAVVIRYLFIVWYVYLLLKVKFIYNTRGEIISIDASNLDVEDVVMLILQRRL